MSSVLKDIRRILLGADGKGLSTTPSTAPAYRADFGSLVGGGSGNIVELAHIFNTGAGGKRIRVQRLFFSKPSVPVTLLVQKQRTLDLAGTSTDAAIVPMDSEKASTLARVKLYTAVPTVGTLVGVIWRGVVGTGDVFTEEFGVGNAAPLILYPGQSLALNVDVAATILGYLMWTEE